MEELSSRIFARDLWRPLGYAEWRNFLGLVLRIDQMIRSGLAAGLVVKTHRIVKIGSGASRKLIDYELDELAHQAVLSLSSSFKLNGYHATRNETAILALLAKWAAFRGVAIEFQKEIGDYRLDLLVGGRIVVEFDEPHHLTTRQGRLDKLRDAFLYRQKLRVARFDLTHDIVDMIVRIEQLLEEKG